MKTEYKKINFAIVIFCVLVTAMFAGCSTIIQPEEPETQKCSNQDGYCVFDNIPSYLKYTFGEIPEELLANRQEVVDEYLG